MRTKLSTVTGVVTEADEAYSRDKAVGWPVLLPVLAAATLGHLVVRALAAILRSAPPGGLDSRGLKELRKGPTCTVKQVWVRDAIDSQVVEIEVHGYLHPKALLPGDHIIASVRPQPRKDLPPLAYEIDNRTTGRVLRPHPPNLWTHLGPGLIIQTAFGVLIAVLVVLALAT
ncbi:MAG TPA: hypothetical protein VFM55_14800 [Micromonosporaceae bacterium]|nr:hypothetical protein [Micromonosporaceae bacterium]